MAKDNSAFVILGLGALAFFLLRRAPVIISEADTLPASTLLPEPVAILQARQHVPILRYNAKPVRNVVSYYDASENGKAPYWSYDKHPLLGPPMTATTR